MKVKWLSLTIGLAFAYCTHCSGAYVVFRTGFGNLKGEKLTMADNNTINQPKKLCTPSIQYTNHHNLSVALGGRIDVLGVGAIGIELELLGAYATTKSIAYNQKGFQKSTNVPYMGNFLWTKNESFFENENQIQRKFFKLFSVKNQRIVGAQINIYWEQYVLDWLSVGIGGGIGGAYICSKFYSFEQTLGKRVLGEVLAPLRVHRRIRTNDNRGWLEVRRDRMKRFRIYPWQPMGMSTSKKYVHTGSLLYNFNLFVRAEMFETLFEVGYRHIGLHQMFGAKLYGHEIYKLGNMYSDQVYLGIGRTF